MTAPGHAGAGPHGLTRLGGRPSLGTYLRLLWQRRHFTTQLARSRFRAEHEQDRLGAAWPVLRPLIMAAVYGTVFGLLLPRDSRPPNFVLFLVTGVFIFQYFSTCLADGARSISGNLGLVRSLHFPRALLPVATVLQATLQLVAMVAALLALTVGTGEPVRLAWLQLLPALGLMMLFNTGVALVTGRATIHVRDIAQLLPFLTRIVFYVSGIFYSLDRVIPPGALLSVLQLNPVHVYITLARGALMAGEPAPPSTWWLGVAWGLGTLVLGFVFFWRAEERYGRE